MTSRVVSVTEYICNLCSSTSFAYEYPEGWNQYKTLYDDGSQGDLYDFCPECDHKLQRALMMGYSKPLGKIEKPR